MLMNDERHALEALLEATKQYVGKDRQNACDNLLRELRPITKKLSKMSGHGHRDIFSFSGNAPVCYPIPPFPLEDKEAKNLRLLCAKVKNFLDRRCS